MNDFFAYPVAGTADMPAFPIAPDGNAPAYPGGGTPMPPMLTDENPPARPSPSGSNVPALPIAPGGGLPAYPGNGNSNVPVPPIAPGGGLPAYPGPSFPNRPNFPGIILPVPPIEGLASVRFLHAAINTPPVTISIGSRTVATDLRYGTPSDYVQVADGFRTVTVMSARSPRAVLFRQNLPFRAGERMTIALVNTSTGIELMTVPDNTCASRPQGLACFRMVNLSYNSMPVDLILYDGRLVFADVRFKEITSYRRVRPGEYGFYVAVTPSSPAAQLGMSTDIETVEDMPIIVSDNYVPGYGNLVPLTTFYESFRAGVMYTAYFLGVGGNPSYPYSVVTLQTQS